MGLSNYLPSSRISQSGVCTSTTRPASPYEGQVIYETDTDRVLVWNASAWVVPNSQTANPPGLELISTTTIGTGVTSVPVNDCFSSSYQSYRIIIMNQDTNGTASHLIQLNGITASNYVSGGSFGSWTIAGQTGYGSPLGTQFVVSANILNGFPSTIVMDITNPNVALRKYGSSFASGANGHATFNHQCTSTLTATGFTLSKAGDTMTGGTIRVYGYRN